MSTNTLPNLHKVSHVFTWWDNGRGVQCKKEPQHPSANGMPIQSIHSLAMWHPLFPDETELERAIRLGILDTWYFVCELIMNNGHKLVYKGEAAVKIYDSYKGIVFSKKKKHNHMKF